MYSNWLDRVRCGESEVGRGIYPFSARKSRHLGLRECRKEEADLRHGERQGRGKPVSGSCGHGGDDLRVVPC